MNGFINDKDNFIQECKNSGEFNAHQMLEIRLGLRKGLTIEQVKFYANLKYDWNLMNMIRNDFENGFTIEQVKIYANPKFTVEEMIKLRKLIV